MAKKTELSDADQDIFKKAMKGVRRLKYTKISTHSPTPSVKKKFSRPVPDKTSTHEEEAMFNFSDYETLELVDSEDPLEFARPGIQHKILRKLRKGQYNIEATLDLHGMTVEKSRHSLSRFLLRCHHKGLRYVLIIHGKGKGSNKPILKNKLNHWLRQSNEILAFCSATTKIGGSGALYVLLRRSQVE
jgi:DNA-nicking Smr family endonuclease